MSTAKIRSADTVALVRSLRELYELTQEQFAAKLGVSLVTINRWENDRAKPAILILAKSCSSPGNACIVRTSERAKRARTVERTGVV